MTTTTDTLTARHVAAGHREDHSRAQLAALIDAFDGADLELALVEDGFATEAEAHEFTEPVPDVAVIDTIACCQCGYSSSFAVTTLQAAAYQAGVPVHEVFPAMPADVREMLISGTHPECWEALFGPDEDDD